MSLAIIDNGTGLTVFDMRTGRQRSVDSPKIQLVKEVLNRHPFPGYTNNHSNHWVTDTALDLVGKYDPGFVFLVYAQQYYSFAVEHPAQAKREQLIDEVFSEVERFRTESGFVPLVVGTGEMIPVYDCIDLQNLDGLIFTSRQLSRYAGLYGMSPADMCYLRAIAGIDRLVSKEEFLALFYDGLVIIDRLPEYLAVAQKGYCFGTTPLSQPVMIPSHNYSIPVSTALGTFNSITDIGSGVEAALKNDKIALILIDGVGARDFRIPHTVCSNSKDWYTYEPGAAQYLTISTGRHQVFAYPPGYSSYLENDKSKGYPILGTLTSIPARTVGERFRGKSIAVGNRSMLLHTVTGTDITIECFSGNLSCQGYAGVIQRCEKD